MRRRLVADPVFAVAVCTAGLAAAGLWAATAGMLRPHARLDDAFAVLDGVEPADRVPGGQLVVDDPESRLERVGAWLYCRARLPLPAATARVLMLQGRSIGDYFVNKLVLAVAGLSMPALIAWALRPLTGPVGALPVGAGLVAGIVGWLWPDLQLRNQSSRMRADAQEALNTFFDLVTLERLANLSATQALEAAAQLSDVPVFQRIRAALERARLEQRPPWLDLRQLSADLDLPQIADIADIMRLDDQGAALADVLMARVQELRDAHLAREKAEAHQATERMTLWMSIPVVIFSLAFLIPPLLKIAGQG